MACAVATASSACILPVAPEFQDPEPNLSPYVVNASPPIGYEVGENDEISVVLADPNPQDELSLRWLFNYPPYSLATRLSQPEVLAPSIGGAEVRTKVVKVKPTCFRDLVAGPYPHRAMLIVSDRGFEDPPSTPTDLPFDLVQKDARVLRLTWTVKKVCQ